MCRWCSPTSVGEAGRAETIGGSVLLGVSAIALVSAGMSVRPEFVHDTKGDEL